MLRELDVLLINDGEARMLSGETNPVRAAEKVLAMGPKSLVVKHGEYGATAFFGDRSFRGAQRCRGRFARRRCRWPRWSIRRARAIRLPADSTAIIASQPELTPAVFRTAMFYGGVMGSFAVERFGTERLQAVTREEIDARFELFREISHLDDAAV